MSDLLKEYGEMLKKPKKCEVRVEAQRINEPNSNGNIYTPYLSADNINTGTITLDGDWSVVGRNESFPEDSGATVQGEWTAETIQPALGTWIQGLSSLVAREALIANGDGTIITRNSQGEEVIRIDTDGIYINGRLIVSARPQTLAVNIDTDGDFSRAALDARLRRREQGYV
jgi:hypothetical protein